MNAADRPTIHDPRQSDLVEIVERRRQDRGHAMINAEQHPVAVTFFDNFAATAKHEEVCTLGALATRILAITASSKNKLPWLKCARFGMRRSDKDSLRHDDNVVAITGIEADYDQARVSFEAVCERLHQAGVMAIVYTSPSYTANTPKWRVLCPFSAELPPGRRNAMMGRLAGLLHGIGAAISTESWTLSRSYYCGSVKHNPAHRVRVIDGTPIDGHDDLDEIWIGKPNGARASGSGRDYSSGPLDEAALCTAILNGESYHTACVRLAGRWAFDGVPLVETRRRLEALFDGVPETERDDRWRRRRDDVARCVLDYGKEAAKPPREEEPPPEWDAQRPPAERASERRSPSGGSSPANGGGAAVPHELPVVDWHDVISLADLEHEVIEALRWIVPDYIPEGLTVFAGRPKIGKSWLMLGVALAVARGRDTLGKFVEQGDVLYCGLQDGKRRMQARVTKILGPAITGWPANFSFRRRLAPLGQGGLDTIEKWLVEHPNRRLVVIDVLGRVRGAKRRDEDAYNYDYRLLAGLQELAIRYRVAIVVVHHVRKTDAEDVLDTISGTTGIAGAADTALVLGRTKHGVRLAGRGRDTEDVDKLVEFDPETGLWAVTGDYDEAAPDSEMAHARRAIFDLLDGSPLPLTPKTIAERLGKQRNVLRVMLIRMLNTVPSQVVRNPDGSYTTPSRTRTRA